MSTVINKLQEVTGLSSTQTTSDSTTPQSQTQSQSNPTSTTSPSTTSTHESTTEKIKEAIISRVTGSSLPPNHTNPLVNPPGGKPLEISDEARRARTGRHGSITAEEPDTLHDKHSWTSGTARRSRA